MIVPFLGEFLLVGFWILGARGPCCFDFGFCVPPLLGSLHVSDSILGCGYAYTDTY